MKLNVSRQVLPIVAIICIVVAVFFIATSQPDRSLAVPATQPPSAPAEMRRRGVVAGAGVVEPSSELIEIGSHTAGVVDRVYVAAGDQVGAGALLFTIDSRDARARVAEAAARVERLRSAIAASQTSLTVARRQLALYENVTDQRAVSRQEVIERRGVAEDASARVSVARAEVAEAQAALRSARVALDLHQVRAPRAAQVLQVRTRAGEFAPAGQMSNNAEPLMTMGVTLPLHVRVDIDENEIERVDLGKPAVVSARGDAAGRVRANFVRAEPLVVPKRSLTNAATERVDVRVLQLIYALPLDGHRLFSGQQIDAFVPAKGVPRR